MARDRIVVMTAGWSLFLSALLSAGVITWALHARGWLWPVHGLVSDLASGSRWTAGPVNRLAFQVPGVLVAVSAPGSARWLRRLGASRRAAPVLLACTGALLFSVGSFPWPSRAHWPIVAVLAVVAAGTLSAFPWALRERWRSSGLRLLFLLTTLGVAGNVVLLRLPFRAAYQRATLGLGLSCLAFLGVQMLRDARSWQDD